MRNKVLLNQLASRRRILGMIVAIALWLFIFAAVYHLVADFVPYRVDRETGDNIGNGIAATVALLVATGVTNLSVKGYRVADLEED